MELILIKRLLLKKKLSLCVWESKNLISKVKHIAIKSKSYKLLIIPKFPIIGLFQPDIPIHSTKNIENDIFNIKKLFK